MKSLLTLSLLALSFQSFAVDMSKTESWKTAYKELADGSSEYIGKCSTHQDYEGKHFKLTKTLVKYFEPSYDNRENDTKKHLKNIDPKLIKAVVEHLKFDTIADVDDLTIETIESKTFKNLDLIRLNIGVGGGNGMFVVFNKVTKNNKVTYELMSSVMDGDVEFCDSKVWL